MPCLRQVSVCLFVPEIHPLQLWFKKRGTQLSLLPEQLGAIVRPLINLLSILFCIRDWQSPSVKKKRKEKKELRNEWQVSEQIRIHILTDWVSLQKPPCQKKQKTKNQWEYQHQKSEIAIYNDNIIIKLNILGEHETVPNTQYEHMLWRKNCADVLFQCNTAAHAQAENAVPVKCRKSKLKTTRGACLASTGVTLCQATLQTMASSSTLSEPLDTL